MIEQPLQVNEEAVVHKLTIYMFLQKFYAGQLNHLCKQDWEELIGLMQQEMSFFSQENIKQGLNMLAQFSDEDLAELEFEYNRLFVGPKRLEASPYESTYMNDERTVMQNETMAVRRFYEKAGLAVSKQNMEPDDHLALELEFVCYLLEKSTEDDMYEGLYQDFLKEHLFQWIDSHCKLVCEKSNNLFLTGISSVLQGLMLEEKSHVFFEGGK